MIPPRIDTHLHVVPPFYADWLRGLNISAGGRAIPDWTPETALDLMESVGAVRSVLSVSTPGVNLGDGSDAIATGRTMARRVNEYAAEQKQRFPERFGYFASLNLPDIDGSLEELAYAFDHLQADGVVLLANVRGRYLGDSYFEPLMQELNRRKAIVFVHPSELPAPPVDDIPPFGADFLLDTTRAAINMARKGWLNRYANLRIILSHAGGFLPYAAERVARLCSVNADQAEGLALLKQYYFDTALSSSPYALPSLLAFAKPERILFGSDWPYAPKERSNYFAGLLDVYPLTSMQRQAIHQDNALALFPRWATP